MKLNELHVFKGHTYIKRKGETVTCRSEGVRSRLENSSTPTCGKHSCLGMKHLRLTSGDTVSSYAATTVLIKEQRFNEDLVVNLHSSNQTLIIEGVHDHAPCPVRSVTSSFNWSLSEVSGMPSETSLSDLALLVSAEGNTHLLQFVDCSWSLPS